MLKHYPFPLPDLQAGDVLLYFDSFSPVDWAIGMRTWCWSASHVEVSCGSDRGFFSAWSWASRNGLGVNRYPFRRPGLQHILRPKHHFNLHGANEFFNSTRGTPYGWRDLLQFYSIKIATRGLICSQFADLLLRAAGVPAFSHDYLAGAICPRDFLISAAFERIWAAKKVISGKSAAISGSK